MGAGGRARKGPRRPRWLQGWRATLLALGLLVAIYVAYSLSVSLSNGRLVELELRATLGDDGAVRLGCGPGSTPSVCQEGESSFTVRSRDRVHVVLVPEGNATYEALLQGGEYWLWPAGFRLTAQGEPAQESFTAWASGTFVIQCSVDEGSRLPCATLVVA